MKWYKNKYRRHLCDIHIDDWDESFLSEFSPQVYVENLKKAHIQAAMIYFQSHIGLCNFPVKNGHMHKAFIGKENQIEILVDLCHQNKIDVIGYYSLIYNNLAHDDFPAWRMIKADGRSARESGWRYGFCCPNSVEYREFTLNQIDEIMQHFKVEGMFYDMPIWPHLCYCEHCKKRWAEEVGGMMPIDAADPSWEHFAIKREEWMSEFAQMVTKRTKEHNPHCSVEQNLAGIAMPKTERGVAAGVNDACDYAGGDLYGGLMEQSFACKLYYSITKNQPFEYMTGRCNPDLRQHTITHTKDYMTTVVGITIAHHGATLLIDAIDPVGTMDSRVYDMMGDVFNYYSKYEPFIRGEMVGDIGVFYGLSGKINRQGQNFMNYHCALGTVKNMIEHNILSQVITSYQQDTFSKYKMIVAGNLNNIDRGTIEKLIAYVRDGGVLYFSNVDEMDLVTEFLGATVKQYTKENVVYISPRKEYEELFTGFSSKYPLPVDCRVPVLEGIPDENIVATVTKPYTAPGKKFASIHSNPPGIPTDIPAVVIKQYGKGKVIWSAAPIEKESIRDYKKIFINLIQYAVDVDFTIMSDAPKDVELVLFDDSDNSALRISMVNLNCIDIADTILPFTVSLKIDRLVKDVHVLPGKTKMPFEQSNGYLTFKTNPLYVFDMYQINY